VLQAHTKLPTLAAYAYFRISQWATEMEITESLKYGHAAMAV